MSDLIERLRNYRLSGNQEMKATLRLEAADEIERLQKHVVALVKERLDSSTQTCSTIFGKPYGEWKELEAENERLREAIKAVLQRSRTDGEYERVHVKEWVGLAAALEGEL